MLVESMKIVFLFIGGKSGHSLRLYGMFPWAMEAGSGLYQKNYKEKLWLLTTIRGKCNDIFNIQNISEQNAKEVENLFQ